MSKELPKAAVHSVYRYTEDGLRTNWLESLVVIGPNPLGPRGGSSGVWVDGKPGRRFKTRDEALKHVEELRKKGKVQ